MKAEILAIGTELLMGEIVDTNSAFLASRCPALGVQVRWSSHVGDDLDDLTEALQRALGRADIVLCCGGLGPTYDDLTRQAVARAVGEEDQLHIDPELVRQMEEYFRRRGTPMPVSNLQQAQIIPSAISLPNRRGTAPGWWVEKGGKVIVTMPGPPRELQEIWEAQVAPRIRRISRGQVILTRTIKTLGLGEALVGEMVASYFGQDNPYLGIYAKPDGIHLRIIARGPTQEAARALIAPVEQGIRQALEPHIWGYDDEEPQELIGGLLRRHGLTLATMESCTGGLLASTITDVPGASDYFRGGIVSYATDVKVQCGVDPAVIEKHGVISEECAAAMAQAVQRFLRADVGVGVTGVAGPSEMEGKPVGQVHFAIAVNGHVQSFTHRFPPNRDLVKRRAVVTTLVELVRVLKSGVTT